MWKHTLKKKRLVVSFSEGNDKKWWKERTFPSEKGKLFYKNRVTRIEFQE